MYFENVRGAVFDAVLPRLNVGAHIPLCGFVASYIHEKLPAGPNRVPLPRLTLWEKLESFRRDMTEWVKSGQVKLREDVGGGLENAPAAFIGLLAGGG